MTDEQRSQLIKLAGEMVRCENMPPYFVSDWDLPRTTPLKAKREINTVSQMAHTHSAKFGRNDS
jgi:hypothetical protein